MSCDCQTARRVGEWERQTSAEDEGGPLVQAAHRHSCAAGPQHLQVRMWNQKLTDGGAEAGAAGWSEPTHVIKNIACKKYVFWEKSVSLLIPHWRNFAKRQQQYSVRMRGKKTEYSYFITYY